MSVVKIISSATSDLVSDQRVHRICTSLSKQGFEVEAVGRTRPTSLELKQRSYQTHRFSLKFHKGPLFYLEYNVKLFNHLMKQNANVLLSNDLDSLLANTLVSIIKGIPLVYDSHEYFTEVPELKNRKFVRFVWKLIEKMCIHRPVKMMTVSQSIADAYNKEYKTSFKTVRNFPESYDLKECLEKTTVKWHKEANQKIILYQGSVNVDRGLEEMIAAMQYLPNFSLHILGDGDVLEDLKIVSSSLDWNSRIYFHGSLPFEMLTHFTLQADLGISIEKKNGLSYTYALPNKVFDYIQAGLPVLMSDLPELKKLNDEFHFGLMIENHDPKEMAEKIKSLFDDSQLYNQLKKEVLKARASLNWNSEEQKIKVIFADFLDQA